MTEAKVIDLVEALLKEQGFTHLSKAHSAHSATLSAEKGANRLVMHITDQVEPPNNSSHNEKGHPGSAIKASAKLPGLSPDADGRVLQRAGEGSTVSRTPERPKHGR